MESGVIVRNPMSGETFLAACEGGIGATWDARKGSVILKLASVVANQPFRLDITALGKTNEAPNEALALSPMITDLRPLTRGGAPLWPQPVITKGERAARPSPHRSKPESSPACSRATRPCGAIP